MPSKVAPGDDIVGEAFTPQAYKTPFSAERVRGIAPQQVQLADGRQLEYFLDGDPSKPAVFLIHGQWGRGNYWLGPPRDDVFMVCPTRPNYFGSTPHPGNNYATFADDVRQLANHLEISSFHVLGASSGGPYALAIKASLNERVGKCVLISSDTEKSKRSGELMCCAPGCCCACCLPCCIESIMAPMVAGMLDPEKMWAMMQKGPAKSLGITQAELDGWLIMGEERSKHATAIIQEAYTGKNGAKGATADFRLEAKAWAGSYVAALAALDDVEMWHGDEDKTVPFSAALNNKARVPKATLHKVNGMGHELGVFLLEARLDELAAAPLTMER